MRVFTKLRALAFLSFSALAFASASALAPRLLAAVVAAPRGAMQSTPSWFRSLPHRRGRASPLCSLRCPLHSGPNRSVTDDRNRPFKPPYAKTASPIGDRLDELMIVVGSDRESGGHLTAAKTHFDTERSDSASIAAI